MTKYFNILFVKGIVDRFESTGVVAVVVEPGIVSTSLVNNSFGRSFFFSLFIKCFGTNPDNGAITQVYASTVSQIKNGSSWKPTAQPWNINFPIKKDDVDLLWNISEDILNKKYLLQC